MARNPAHTVGQPSASKRVCDAHVPPSSSPVVSLLVSSLSCSPLRRFGRTRVHGFLCAWTSGTCLTSSCWRKGFGDGVPLPLALARTVSPSFSSSVSRCLYFRILPGRGGWQPQLPLLFSLFVCCRTRRLQRVQLFLRSFVLYRPWIPGEHRRGICAVECVAAHLRGFEEDSRPEVVFWIDELSIEFVFIVSTSRNMCC